MKGKYLCAVLTQQEYQLFAKRKTVGTVDFYRANFRRFWLRLRPVSRVHRVNLDRFAVQSLGRQQGVMKYGQQ